MWWPSLARPGSIVKGAFCQVTCRHEVFESLLVLDADGLKDHARARLAVLKENVGWLTREARVGHRRGRTLPGIRTEAEQHEVDGHIKNIEMLIPEMAEIRDALFAKRDIRNLMNKPRIETDIGVEVGNALSRVEPFERENRFIPGRGAQLDPINEVPQVDFRNEIDEDALRGIEDLRKKVVKKIGRRMRHGRNLPARGNDYVKGTPVLDGHEANLDRAIADLERRRDRLPRGELRDQVVAMRRKLNTQKQKVQVEREIRQFAEAERLRVAEEAQKEMFGRIRRAREFFAHYDKEAVDRIALDMDPARDPSPTEVDAALKELKALFNEVFAVGQIRPERIINEADRDGDLEDLEAQRNDAVRFLRELSKAVKDRNAVQLNERFIAAQAGRVEEIRELLARGEHEGIEKELQDIKEKLEALPAYGVYFYHSH